MVMFLKAKQLESEGKKIIHLEVGEPDYMPPVSVKHELLKTFEKRHVHYTQTTGISTKKVNCKREISKGG